MYEDITHRATCRSIVRVLKVGKVDPCFTLPNCCQIEFIGARDDYGRVIENQRDKSSSPNRTDEHWRDASHLTPWDGLGVLWGTPKAAKLIDASTRQWEAWRSRREKAGHPLTKPGELDALSKQITSAEAEVQQLLNSPTDQTPS